MSLRSFTDAYVETALWSSTDDEGEPLDKQPELELSDDTVTRMKRDAASFYEKYSHLLPDDAQGGHDFWLTRNGHGAGFWDGDYEEPDATTLTDAAHGYGEYDLYVGDDGEIHGSGGREQNPSSSGRLTRCKHCGAYIDPRYGADSPAEHQGHEGTKDDPRAPGDYDNICDVCNYGKGLSGREQNPGGNILADYEKRFKVRGYRSPQSVFSVNGLGDEKKIINLIYPDRVGDKAWHAEQARDWAKLQADAANEHSALWRSSFEKTFGEPPKFYDFKISGVGNDKLPAADKDRLRYLAQFSSKAGALAQVHASLGGVKYHHSGSYGSPGRMENPQWGNPSGDFNGYVVECAGRQVLVPGRSPQAHRKAIDRGHRMAQKYRSVGGSGFTVTDAVSAHTDYYESTGKGADEWVPVHGTKNPSDAATRALGIQRYQQAMEALEGSSKKTLPDGTRVYITGPGDGTITIGAPGHGEGHITILRDGFFQAQGDAAWLKKYSPTGKAE